MESRSSEDDMNKEEIAKFESALQGIASATGARPLDENALGFWKLTLSSFSYQEVRMALVNWAKSQKHMPRPAEIVEMINRKRVAELDAKRKEIADADRRDRQLNAEHVDVEAVISKIHDATDNADKGTLTATHDAYNRPYTKEELYVRTVMAETAHMNAPAIYVERAKRFLRAATFGIKLSPMQITWAEKVLES